MHTPLPEHERKMMCVATAGWPHTYKMHAFNLSTALTQLIVEMCRGTSAQLQLMEHRMTIFFNVP